jgi:hypothetical protein
MPSVILQPADIKHFNATIAHPVSLDRIAAYLSPDELKALSSLYPERLIPVWGVTPGTSGTNASKWSRMRPEDIVLFVRSKEIFCLAKVSFKTINRQVAKELWEQDKKGQFWEHLYFLNDIRTISVPMSEVSKVIPYAVDFVRSFTVLDKVQSDNVWKLLESKEILEAQTSHVRPLERFNEYSRKEVHDIFAPDTAFTPQAGTWGLQGIVEIPERPGNFAFFVTLGQTQGEHHFEEGVTEDGVLTWQSQPRQGLGDEQIKRLINHNEDRNTIYLLLRTNRNRDYTYLGDLKYLSHDPIKENPVYFEWQILDWEPPAGKLEAMALPVLPKYQVGEPDRPLNSLTLTQPPTTHLPAEEERRGTRRFRGRKSPDYAQRDARNRGLGKKGEELVLEYEKRHLIDNGRPDLAAQVRHVSFIEGDGTGYDISSFTTDGQKKYIEVKTTEGDVATDFFISPNEVEFSTIHADQYYLYRVYEFDTSKNCGTFFVHAGALNPRFKLEASQFRAKLV